jgi:hypothetical protein
MEAITTKLCFCVRRPIFFPLWRPRAEWHSDVEYKTCKRGNYSFAIVTGRLLEALYASSKGSNLTVRPMSLERRRCYLHKDSSMTSFVTTLLRALIRWSTKNMKVEDGGWYCTNTTFTISSSCSEHHDITKNDEEAGTLYFVVTRT